MAALRHETVDRLGEMQAKKKRGKPWQDLPRRALVDAALARHWGKTEGSDGDAVELTVLERSLVDRIAAAVEKQ